MNARSFIDTNVLVYTDDHDEPDKQARANTLITEILRQGTGVLSTQILQEYFNTVTRKLGVSAAVARRKVELYSSLNLVPISLDDILSAIDLHRLHQFSFWDALVIQAALSSGCSRLLSEDLQTGRKINGLEILNPFE